MFKNHIVTLEISTTANIDAAELQKRINERIEDLREVLDVSQTLKEASDLEDDSINVRTLID